MDNSVYVALSKQVGAQRQLNVIANNIANANTTGFKAEEMVFKEYLVDDADNRATAYAQDIATIRNTTQGSLQQTGADLDFALSGPGYFAVQTPEGIRYTRAGNFTIDGEGVLSTQDGHAVMSESQAVIQLEDVDTQFVVFGDGRIEIDGLEREKLGVFQFNNELALEPLSSGLYAADENPELNIGEAKVAQGFLERSNVEPISQMTNLIKLQRVYEGTAKFISGLYEIQEDAIRRIARQS